MVTSAKILHQVYRTIEAYSEDKHAVFKAPNLGVALSYLNQMLEEWAFYQVIDVGFIVRGDAELEISLGVKNAIIYNMAWLMAVHWGHAVDLRLKRQADFSLEGLMRWRPVPPVILDRVSGLKRVH